MLLLTQPFSSYLKEYNVNYLSLAHEKKTMGKKFRQRSRMTQPACNWPGGGGQLHERKLGSWVVFRQFFISGPKDMQVFMF